MGNVSAASAIVAGDSGEDVVGKGGDGKLSLRMKLVTPVEEVCSERFSLQSENRLASSRRHTLTPGGALIF